MSYAQLTETTHLYKQLLNGKEEYLICAKEANLHSHISALYLQAEVAFRNTLSASYDEISARLIYQDTLKPQINPYTMGGIASGIAGPGAGIYAAHETAKNNAAQDQAKSHYSNEVDDASENASSSIASFSTLIKALQAAIQSLPGIQETEKKIAYRKALEDKKGQAEARIKSNQTNIDDKKDAPRMLIFSLILFLLFLSGAILGFVFELYFFGVLGVIGFLVFLACFASALHTFITTKPKENAKLLKEAQNDWAKYNQELEAYKASMRQKSYESEKKYTANETAITRQNLTHAECALKGNNPADAIKYSNIVLGGSPDNYQAWMIYAQAIGKTSSLYNKKFKQSIDAARKAIEFAPHQLKENTANTLVKVISNQILALLPAARDLETQRLTSGGVHIQELMMLWLEVLKLPHISKETLKQQIEICNNLYSKAKASFVNADRMIFNAAMNNNHRVPYHVMFKKELTPEELTKKESKEKAGCYVATCVYGSYDCPQVWTLRRYRDHTLAESWCGRLFIHLYYAISPTLVKWFGHTKWFKRFWQKKLDRMVAKLQRNGVESTPYFDTDWRN